MQIHNLWIKVMNFYKLKPSIYLTYHKECFKKFYDTSVEYQILEG